MRESKKFQIQKKQELLKVQLSLKMSVLPMIQNLSLQREGKLLKIFHLQFQRVNL